MDIKPIETFYNRYRFRSRLEARWAVFFDKAGIKYQYEPQGYKLSDGTWYLPDFYLPDVETEYGKGLWCEVKNDLERDLSKPKQFAMDGKYIAIITSFDGSDNGLIYYDKNAGMIFDENCYFYKCEYCNTYIYCDSGLATDPIFHSEKCNDKFNKISNGMILLAKEVRDLYYNYSNVKLESELQFSTELFLHGKYIRDSFIDHLDNAVTKAKQARFEHGECG